MKQRPSELLIALRMPSDVIDNLLEIDGLYDKMERQYSKWKAEQEAAAKALEGKTVGKK